MCLKFYQLWLQPVCWEVAQDVVFRILGFLIIVTCSKDDDISLKSVLFANGM